MLCLSVESPLLAMLTQPASGLKPRGQAVSRSLPATCWLCITLHRCAVLVTGKYERSGHLQRSMHASSFSLPFKVSWNSLHL